MFNHAKVCSAIWSCPTLLLASSLFEKVKRAGHGLALHYVYSWNACPIKSCEICMEHHKRPFAANAPQERPQYSTQAKIAFTCDTWNDEMSTSSDFKCVGSMQMQTCVFLSHATILEMFPPCFLKVWLMNCWLYWVSTLHPGFKRFVMITQSEIVP